MAEKRPTIEPMLLASMIEAAPGRVRRRLDKEPDIAQSWQWLEQDGQFAVTAGEEVVQIATDQGVVSRLEQISCSCLLAPKCHHILACVTLLSPAAADATDDRPSPDDPQGSLAAGPQQDE